MNKSLILFALLFTMVSNLYGQEVFSFKNPSFEDSPRKGQVHDRKGSNNNIKGWFDCGFFEFKNETAPDIHSATSNYWNVSREPSHGETFLGLVTRDNNTWESVSQELDNDIKAGKCYSFSIDLCQYENYRSKSRLNINSKDLYSYNKPIVLRIWGGIAHCNLKHLIYESEPIHHQEWKTYSINMVPTQTFDHITLQAYYREDTPIPYNGHILVDNLSEVVEVECKD